MIIYGSINLLDRSLEISSRDLWTIRGSRNFFLNFFFFLLLLSDVPPRIFIRRSAFSPLSYARIMRVIRVAMERVE